MQIKRAVFGSARKGLEDGGVIHHQDVGIGHEELEAGHAFIHHFVHVFEAGIAEIGDDHVQAVVDARFAFGFLEPRVERVAHARAARLDGEIDDARRAAECGGAGAGFEIVGGSSAAEGHVKVRVNVDTAGHDVKAGGVDHVLAGARFEAGTHFRDAFAFDTHVSGFGLVGRDYRAVADEGAHNAVRCSQLWNGRPVSTRSMVMQSSTGTDQPTEIAADALSFVDARDAMRRSVAVGCLRTIELSNRSDGGGRQSSGRSGQMDALVGAVPAGDVAEIAADAFFGMNAGDDLVVQVQMFPLGDFRNRVTEEIADRRKAFCVHPIAQPIDHVFHDAVAIVHRGGTHLHRTAAEQDELGGLAPSGNAADAGDGNADVGIGSDLLHHVQGDWLHGGAAIAAVR